jgi:hypothetical protein
LYDIFKITGCFFGGRDPPEVRGRQKDFRENVQTDGQSSETVPTSKDELEKFAPFYFRYIAGHLSEIAIHMFQIRG